MYLVGYEFELRNYLKEWIGGLNVSTYRDLKEFIVADQLKRKISSSIHEYFIDDLLKITNVHELVDTLDQSKGALYDMKKEVCRDT